MSEVTKGISCILTDYRRDKCDNCTQLCEHRIALHGLTGDTGRVGGVGLPLDYQNVTLGNSPVKASQPKIYDMLGKYVETFRRTTGERVKSLYLWSESPGTGKTTTASAIINGWIASEYLTAIKDGRQPEYTNAAFLDVNEFQTSYNLSTMSNSDEGIQKITDEIQRLQIADFAVLDDVGIRSATDSFKSLVHMIINHRTTYGKPTVYTSNLALKEMEQVFDARLYDRMRDQCAEIHFDGTSKRGRR